MTLSAHCSTWHAPSMPQHAAHRIVPPPRLLESFVAALSNVHHKAGAAMPPHTSGCHGCASYACMQHHKHTHEQLRMHAQPCHMRNKHPMHAMHVAAAPSAASAPAGRHAQAHRPHQCWHMRGCKATYWHQTRKFTAIREHLDAQGEGTSCLHAVRAVQPPVRVLHTHTLVPDSL
jgi:hypothetical protein